MLGESISPKGAEPALQAYRRDKHQPEPTGPINTRDNQMAKGKHRNVTNRNQGNIASSEPYSPTTESLGFPNIPEKQDWDSKSQLMMGNEGFKKDINNTLKEIHMQTGKGPERITGKDNKTSAGTEQKHPGSKSRGKNN